MFGYNKRSINWPRPNTSCKVGISRGNPQKPAADPPSRSHTNRVTTKQKTLIFPLSLTPLSRSPSFSPSFLLTVVESKHPKNLINSHTQNSLRTLFSRSRQQKHNCKPGPGDSSRINSDQKQSQPFLSSHVLRLRLKTTSVALTSIRP